MEWLDDEMNQRILREVDHCEFNGFRMQDLEEGYTFAIDDISTGSKALMLVNELDDIKIWGTAFGDNCLDLLLQMAEEKKDITIYLQHVPGFQKKKYVDSLTKCDFRDKNRDFIQDPLTRIHRLPE